MCDFVEVKNILDKSAYLIDVCRRKNSVENEVIYIYCSIYVCLGCCTEENCNYFSKQVT